MKIKIPCGVLLFILFTSAVHACIWDADTLSHEKSRSHDLAKVILGEPPPPENPLPLQERIKNLEANPQDYNPDWWNNLAGAYLRLNQPATAVKLLEPVVSKFPNDYGLHANLGTAYHLLGRYPDAEKEIARDLAINPNAHFGLEKYHLALLQYLVRDAKYQSRHVFVDEFTAAFLSSEHGHSLSSEMGEYIFKTLAQDYTNNVAAAEADYTSLLKSSHDEHQLMEQLGIVASLDLPPPYRTQWNLATDTNLEAGIIYMAEMNPKEPACFEMLGIAAWNKHDYHLAINAFEKAIALGSPQSNLLKYKIIGLRDYIHHSTVNRQGPELIILVFLILIPALVAYYFYARRRDQKRKRPTNT